MKKYVADILTFLRIILAFALLFLGIAKCPIWLGLVIFLIAELTDAFDGFCSQKWPFTHGKEPKYRKFAVVYDMVADVLLWTFAIVFFAIVIDAILGIAIIIMMAILCGVVEFFVYGKLFGHPDDCTKNSLCAKDFNLAKKIIMTRRFCYLFTIVFIAIWMLIASEFNIFAKIGFLVCGFLVCGFLWSFLKTRRKNISRNAISLEEKLSKKTQK